MNKKDSVNLVRIIILDIIIFIIGFVLTKYVFKLI
jgi:hypothetical protein